MISKKPIANKFYKYAGSIVKIKKISKLKNKIFIEKLTNKEIITIPYEQSEILIIRLYTVGEVAKIRILCPDDKKTYENVEVDLSKVEVYVDDNHSNNIVLDETRKLGVVLKYPSLKTINSGILTGDVKLAEMYELITNSIDQIYEGEKVHFAKDTEKKEMEEFVNNLTGEQMKQIQKFFNTMPRLEQKITVKNSKTNVESEVTLKGLADFFG